jgi:hypothetical protein
MNTVFTLQSPIQFAAQATQGCGAEASELACAAILSASAEPSRGKGGKLSKAGRGLSWKFPPRSVALPALRLNFAFLT